MSTIGNILSRKYWISTVSRITTNDNETDDFITTSGTELIYTESTVSETVKKECLEHTLLYKP